jgi:cyclic pyranopterin phosphate synthase
MAAKQTSSLIPLCHNIFLSKVDVALTLEPARHTVRIVATATAVGPTGVEMEALTAVSVAALALYDMAKAASKEIRIEKIQLDVKTGGKGGSYRRAD